MSNNKKDSFLFDTDDSDQQILPFDFLDEDEDDGDNEEKVIKNEVKEEIASEPQENIIETPKDIPAPAEDEQTYETAEETTIEEEETSEETEQVPSSLNDDETEDMKKYAPSVTQEQSKEEETDDKEPESAEGAQNEPNIESETDKVIEEEKTDKTTEKSQIPETVKITAPQKKEKKKEEKPSIDSKLKTPEKPTPISNTSDIKPGQILQEARVKKDLSLDQVSQSTKINKTFIEALEQGDAKNLPAPVYVEAYIKTLCTLYAINSRQVSEGLTKQKPGKVVPGELLHHIEEGKQINTEEEAKVNKFFKIAAILIIIVIVAIIVAVKTASPTELDAEENTSPEVLQSESTQPTEEEITSEDLEIFLYPQPFTMTEMKFPEKTVSEDLNSI